MRLKAFVVMACVALCIAHAASAQQSRSGAFGDTEYRLGPDDVIQVFVWKEPELSTTVVVRPDGKVSLPLIGELPVNGKTALQLQTEVGQKLTQFIEKPVVTVILKEVNSAKVSVLGEVKKPDVYKIQGRATVLDAIALAGGFTEYAKRDKVIVMRVLGGKQERYVLNVEDLIKKQRSELFYVLPYDKIYIQ